MRIALTFIVAAFLMVGCSDSGSDGMEEEVDSTPTPAAELEGYFDLLEGLSNEYTDASDVQEREYEAAPLPRSDAEAVSQARDFWTSFVPLLRAFVDDLAALPPPAEVNQEHSALVQAGRDAVSIVEEMIDFLGQDPSIADADQAGERAIAEAEKFEEACLALEDAAFSRGIVIDLNCVDQ